MQVTLYRHAQSESNMEPHLIGGAQPVTPLTPHGIKQAKALGRRLKLELEQGIIKLPDSITSSTAIRARNTAEIVVEILGISIPIIQDGRLTELSQGDWEGRVRTEIYTKEMCDAINATNGAHCPPSGESQIMVADRMENWLHSRVVGNHWGFTHSLAAATLIQRVLGGPPGLAFLHSLDNTGIVEIEKKEMGWKLKRFNDHSHIHTIS